MGLLNLFGGDKQTTTNQSTSNTDNSVSEVNSRNVSTWAQENFSYVRSDNRVQNLNLQQTDSFNKTNTFNWQNVGNSGSSQESPFLESEGMQQFWRGVFQNPAPGVNSNQVSVDPNANPTNFDFRSQTDSVARQISATGETSSNFFANTAGAVNTTTSNQWKYAAIAAVAVAVLFLFRRK